MNDMNDKKQDNDEYEFEDLRGEEPFVKKAAKLSAFLYLGLAILVVIVATIGIFSISYDDKTVTDISIPTIDLGNISLPETSLPDRPVQHEQSGVTVDVSHGDDSSQSEISTPAAPTYYRPVNGEISKGYSMDALVFSATMKDYRVHPGIDIAAPIGTEVVAYTDGTVLSVTDDYFYGTTVAVEHAEGVVSYYMNLDPELADGVVAGNHIDAGQAIGSVGTSARIESADAPHLHFELRVNGKLVNPIDELP